MNGSTWEKWDLHIHTPMTHLNGAGFQCSIADYVSKLAAKELDLIGVTNYFYFKENELEIVKDEIRAQSHRITVLGNVEFRIVQQNNGGEWINVHVVFSEKLTTTQINTILSSMPITNTSPDGRVVYCSETSMQANGVKAEQAVVDFKRLNAHLSAHLQRGTDYLIGICPNGYGGFRPDIKDGRSVAIALELEKIGDFIFGSTDRDRTFFLNTSRYEHAKERPVFKCSDAHRLEDVGSQYSWIKARPTFEGLRQLLIEPEARVQIEDNFIERTFAKPRFKSITANGSIIAGQPLKFDDTTIELNPNMAAIIGGRGTGKSILLDSIRSKFRHDPLGTNPARQINTEQFSLVLEQGNGSLVNFNDVSNSYDYLHVSQGDIQSVSQNPEQLSTEIKKMLGLTSDAFNPVTTSVVEDALTKYRAFIGYWSTTDVRGNKINTNDHQNSIIINYQGLIATLSSAENQGLIDQYQVNVAQVNKLTAYIAKSAQIKASFTQQIDPINTTINEHNQNKFSATTIPSIDYHAAIAAIEANDLLARGQIAALNLSNQGIVTTFQSQGITQDISSLLGKVTEYQRNIDAANEKLREITARTAEYHQSIQGRCQLSGLHKAHLESNSSAITTAFNSLLTENSTWTAEQNELVKEILSDISIFGAIYFNKENFFSLLLSKLNGGKFRDTATQTSIQRLQAMFPINSYEDFYRLISNEEMIVLSPDSTVTLEQFCWESEYFNQGGRFELLDFLYLPQNIQTYLHANAEFLYKGKTVTQLSVGQRGTFYVCLKLATDPFGSPFIFDQPEDDLDNDFIMNKLVPIFRKIKKYRQVIIVTHNANLVVNSDAEQIIIAKNDNETLTYQSGSVEDGSVNDPSSIRGQICNILEGGGHAFWLRERKYGLNDK